MFSLFFGLNALCSMSGAYTATKIAERFGDKKAITLSIYGCILAASGLLTIANQHYLFSWHCFHSVSAAATPESM